MKNLFILSLLFLVSCRHEGQFTNKGPFVGSIVNGTIVTADNELAKSVVGIFALKNDLWFNKCTASVLSDRLILTAAHCLKGKSPRDLLVSFSLHSLPYGTQVNGYRLDEFSIKLKYVIRNVKSFRTHPKYSGTENDIALILLEEKAPESAVPVKLIPEEYLVRADQRTIFGEEIFEATLMGIGVTDDVKMTESNEMRMVKVPAVFYKNLLITDQRDGRGACLGDSGGPAFVDIRGETYLAGVTHGPHGAVKNCHTEGEFTNPALFTDFIEAAIREFQKPR